MSIDPMVIKIPPPDTHPSSSPTLEVTLGAQSARFWVCFRERLWQSRICKGGNSTHRYYKLHTRDFAFSWDPYEGLSKPRQIQKLIGIRTYLTDRAPTTHYETYSDPDYPILIPQSLRIDTAPYSEDPSTHQSHPVFNRFTSTSYEILEMLQDYPFPYYEYPIRPCPFYPATTHKVYECQKPNLNPNSSSDPHTYTLCKYFNDCQWRNPACTLQENKNS